MGLVRSTDQRMIAETARAFLAEHSGSAARRRALDAGWDAGLWARMTGELGWAGIAIPEAHGGSGLGWADLAVLMEECGRELAMAPFFTTCVPLTRTSLTGPETSAVTVAESAPT